ncbi:MAG: hypothetical protein V9F04_05215 [Dermatophilaceae bacterium]
MSTAGATFSCGATRTWGGSSKIWATPVVGAYPYDANGNGSFADAGDEGRQEAVRGRLRDAQAAGDVRDAELGVGGETLEDVQGGADRLEPLTGGVVVGRALGGRHAPGLLDRLPVRLGRGRAHRWVTSRRRWWNGQCARVGA